MTTPDTRPDGWTSIYDKTGREIVVGDIVKVYHFTGARRKRHYMYKQAARIKTLGPNDTPYMFFSHLDMTDDGYHEMLDGKRRADYEIVQNIDAKFEDRPRLGAPKGGESNG